MRHGGGNLLAILQLFNQHIAYQLCGLIAAGQASHAVTHDKAGFARIQYHTGSILILIAQPLLTMTGKGNIHASSVRVWESLY